MTDAGDPGEESELIQKLRRKAEQLRAELEGTELPDHIVPEIRPVAPPAAEPVETDGPDEPRPEDGTAADVRPDHAPDAERPLARRTPTAGAPVPTRIDIDRLADEWHWDEPDPERRDLLHQWADEEHLETESPRRNWTPLVVLVGLAAVVGLLVLAYDFATADTSSGDDATAAEGDDADPSTAEGDDPPTLDDLTADVTIPPGPEDGLTVADRGVTVVEDRFDAERREGTYAVIIENPHDDLLAQSVQVDVSFLSESGEALGTDQGFVEVVLPGQSVAVGALFFDAPTTPVADIDVVIDVARWRETEPFDGSFATSDVETTEAEFSGIQTTLLLRSSFSEALDDVAVTAVYRDADGAIVGGSDTFIDVVEPETDTPVEIALLANIPVDEVASTEIYPSAGFGFVPDQ